MRGHVSSLVWGVLFNIFYVTLVSSSSTIFRVTGPLSTPVAFVFLFVGEALSTLPLVPFAARNWTVTRPSRVGAYLVLGLFIDLNFIAWRIGAANMPLGPFAAISDCGFLFAPALTGLLLRRCVGYVDVCGIVAAMIGLLLTTHPPFLFAEPVSAPAWAYACAAYNGLNALLYPYCFGATADEHWSNFLAIRLAPSFAVAAGCFALAGPKAIVAAEPTAAMGVAFVGLLSTVYRLAQQVGCYELEEFDAGLAGLMSNVVMSGNIPTTTLMAVGFFHERVSTSEGVGIAVVFTAILVVAVAKGVEKKREEEEKGEKEKLEEEREEEEEEEEEKDGEKKGERKNEEEMKILK